jgi:hypothetical protein
MGSRRRKRERPRPRVDRTRPVMRGGVEYGQRNQALAGDP